MKIEAITNLYTAFRASQESADLWRRYVRKQLKNKPFHHSIMYSYYKQLLEDTSSVRPGLDHLVAVGLIDYTTGSIA